MTPVEYASYRESLRGTAVAVDAADLLDALDDLEWAIGFADVSRGDFVHELCEVMRRELPAAP